MNDAAAVATSVRDGWVIWEVAGKPVVARLSADVVSRLGLAVFEGFKALPRRGLETGGLLIGTRRDHGGRVVVEINDFEAVESEHAAGPSYLLSEADRQLLDSRISARGTSGRKPHVVGFYRSHTRSGFGITIEDEYVFSNYFRKSSDVFLLIKSNGNAPPTGGFLIREGGKILSDTPYAEFSFSPEFALCATREVQPALPPSPPVPMAVPAPPRIAAPVAPARAEAIAVHPTAPVATWRPMAFAAAGAAVLAATVSYAVWRLPPVPASESIATPLALSISNASSGLRLSWNHRASQRASQAILWIRDGELEHKIELDAKQLGEGSIAYWPKTGDVNFRMQLVVPGGAIIESVRSIGGPVRPLEQPAATESAVPSLPQILPVPSSQRASRTETASRPPFRAFEPVQPQIQHVPVAEPPAIAGIVAPAMPADISFLRSVLPFRGPGSIDDAKPLSRVRVEPLHRLSRNFPLVGKRQRQAAYVPPMPLSEPPAPILRAQNLEATVNIDVKVYVNQSGKVEYSEVLSKITPDNRELAAAAVFSARKCEFVPARAGSETAPGEVILHYEFGPVGRVAGDREVATR
jgi:hypothetical protein